MCISPRIIPNKGYDRLGGLPFIEVPCRECEECSDTAQIDYFVRAWSVYRSLPAGWSVWFSTLTFDDEHVPRSPVCYTTWSDLTGRMVHVGNEVMCFDHRILHRFCKSLRQYYRRKYSDYVFEYHYVEVPALVRDGIVIRKAYTCRRRRKVCTRVETERLPHLLISSEFGEKNGRPHYHAIMFIPEEFSSWQSFRDFVTRFWKYGFVKNIAVKNFDSMAQERSVVNSIKYTCKYVLKGSSTLPFYFNHGERVWLKNLEPCYYTPRVFTTYHFGAALEAMLRRENYVQNNVTLSVDGKFRQFNLPAYYRRRFFTSSKLISKEPYYKKTLWSDNKLCFHTKTETRHKNCYDDVRRESLLKRFRIEYERSGVKSVPQDFYVRYMMRDYFDVVHLLGSSIGFDPINSDADYKKIYGDVWQPPEVSLYLQSKRQYYNDSFEFCKSKYARDGLCYSSAMAADSSSVSSCVSICERVYQLRCEDLVRRKRTIRGQRIADSLFYCEHNIMRDVE